MYQQMIADFVRKNRGQSCCGAATLLGLVFLVLQTPASASLPSQAEPDAITSSVKPDDKINPISPLAPSARDSQHFKFKQKINPVWWLENADEPVAPAWYRPGKHNRDLAWHLRNPFHNFDAYVIGVSDKSFTRTGRFPHNVFNPNGGWNWAVCHYKALPLPFIAYERKSVSFYFGWRERGNFGIKLNLAAKKPANSAVAQKRLTTGTASARKIGG